MAALQRAVGVLLALGGLTGAGAATFQGFTDSSLTPKINNEPDMVVRQVNSFGISRTQEGKHPQKFYFVPDVPARSEPRVVVLQSSGQLVLLNSIFSTFSSGTKFLDIDAQVQWDGLMSMAFDPEWPTQPYLYIFYIGYADYGGTGSWPNTNLKNKGAYRPSNWNTSNNRGGCWLVSDKTNYQSVANKCPNYKTSTTNCDSLSWNCEVFSRVDRVKVNPDTFTYVSRSSVYKTTRACSGWWGHLWSNIMFLKDGSMVFGMGDHSIDFTQYDQGDPNGDMCYYTSAGLRDSGTAKGQRECETRRCTRVCCVAAQSPETEASATPPLARRAEGSSHNDIGKFLRVFPGRYRTNTAPVVFGTDYEHIAKGIRNPYSSMVLPDDTIWVGDVGNSQAERIFHFDARKHTLQLVYHELRGSSASKPLYNMGWPCLEGEIGPLLGSTSEQARASYLKNNGYTTCNGVYKSRVLRREAAAAAAAAAALGGGSCQAAGVDQKWWVGDVNSVTAEPNYFSPTYEFRDLPDPSYPDCSGSRAAVSGFSTCYSECSGTPDLVLYVEHREILWNQGSGMGTKYRNKLFFSDHAKRCLFYGSLDSKGKVVNVKALMAGGDVGISHIALHPVSGKVYILDYEHARIISLSSTATTGPSPAPTTAKPTAPGVPPSPAGTLPVKMVSKTCSVGSATDNFGALAWTTNADGTLSATLEFGAIQFTNKYGTTRTRGYNGGIPGPLMRLQACKVYKLTLKNTLSGWADPTSPTLNQFTNPSTTNLHTHGLHVSGMGNADNVLREVARGESAVYTYAIPCDHAGGTHFYHAHHHGGVTLQAGGGAVGLLRVDDNPTFEAIASRPAIYGSMPTRYVVLQYVDPDTLQTTAAAMGDDLFYTTATAKHYLTNGCDDYTMSITLGKWTRLRMLHVGRLDNALVSIQNQGGGDPCIMALLAKDGVYDSAPGTVYTNLFFSISSRVDIALYCKTAGTYSVLLSTVSFTTKLKVATLTVAAGTAVDAATLPAWKPCRPFYLSDLRPVTVAAANSLAITLINGAINDQSWKGAATPYLNKDPFAEGVAAQASIAGTSQHQFHMHVNHFQLQAAYEAGGVANWYKAGDWLDTFASADTGIVKFRVDRYGGDMICHCHVFEHSDTGMMARIALSGGVATDSTNTAVRTARPACP
ncbi:hypothetical protein JKP88DRAFT_348452 [Tribonema minus]|uniref:Multicopper oxidase n=1 Tax=Tribonema minus TaxID=303371 RepID=A0A835Z3E9_9STRA|nr:hypothetical protein JKP88DRAFT_348452 [Tribonema minus]